MLHHANRTGYSKRSAIFSENIQSFSEILSNSSWHYACQKKMEHVQNFWFCLAEYFFNRVAFIEIFVVFSRSRIFIQLTNSALAWYIVEEETYLFHSIEKSKVFEMKRFAKSITIIAKTGFKKVFGFHMKK